MLLSSHVLAEVEFVCDQIAVIRDGRAPGRIHGELRTVRAHRVEAVVRQPGDPAELARIDGVSDAHVEAQSITCTVHGSIGPLLDWLTGCGVVELDSRELSLEKVFLSEFAPEPRPA